MGRGRRWPLKCVDGRCQMQAAMSTRPSHPPRLVEPPGLLLPPPPRSVPPPPPAPWSHQVYFSLLPPLSPPPPPASWSHQVYPAVTAIGLAITATAKRAARLPRLHGHTHACTDARVPARFPPAARQVYPHASRVQGNGWEAPFIRIVHAFKKKKGKK